jgi:hypothetical protein
VNCETLHRELLALERPDAPPPDLSSHLAVCAACRDWHARLLQMEREASTLPVPVPLKKAAFVERFLAEERTTGTDVVEETGKELPSVLRFAPPVQPGLANEVLKTSKRERGLQKMAVAVAMAAALLLVTIGIWAWQRGGSTSRRSSETESLSALEKRLRDTPRWAEARTPDRRLEVLRGLADQAHVKAQSFARAGAAERLAVEVRLFREIIERMTGREAPEIALADRQRVLLPLAHHLLEVESLAERLAQEVPSAASSLRELAAVARGGDRQLRALLRTA